MNTFELHNGDCLEVLRGLASDSIDAIVTDPPYGLSFMGQRWDYDVPSVEVWAECLRVLKPGGHLLAFAGTRTQHRMAVRIEDAGFEIRDMIAWVYGSGFPKSLDISKAIDKAGGSSPREQADMLRLRREAAGLTREQVAEHCGCTPSSVRDWEEGRARASGAPIEFIVPSAEYRAKLANLLGYSADERRLIGKTSDRRCDGTVYGVGHSGELREGGITDAARQWQGWGTALKPALEPITVARKPLVGTVAANVQQYGTGGLNIDGCRVTTDDDTARTQSASGTFSAHPVSGVVTAGGAAGRWPANLIHDGSEEVLAAFPNAPGQIADASTNADARKTQNAYGAMRRGRGDEPSADSENEGAVGFKMKPVARRLDSGSAARFFYCAKASRKDRNEGCEGMDQKMPTAPNGAENAVSANRGSRSGPRENHHPTVKPTDLMRYLCRLVTPPGGVVLDPFTGSGSTGKAAILEGFRFIGIEREAEYVEIARARIEAVMPKPEPPVATEPQLALFP